MFIFRTISIVLIFSLYSCFANLPEIVMTLAPVSTAAPTATPSPSPTAVPTPTPKPPEKEGLENLKSQIEELVSRLGGEWGVYIKNLETNEYMMINEHEMYSASLIKLFIMAAVYNEIEAGTITKDEHISELLETMITESSNDAANELCEILGNGDMLAGFDLENVHTRSIDCTYTIQNTDLQDNRANSTIEYRGRNYTSPRDCGHLLELIYNGELCGPENSAEMLEYLKNQQTRYKIPQLLPEGTVIANKTGEMTGVENDAAIIYSPNCDYIICIMSNDAYDNSEAISGVQDISQLVYNYFNS